MIVLQLQYQKLGHLEELKLLVQWHLQQYLHFHDLP
jgi:hypothetical protein